MKRLLGYIILLISLTSCHFLEVEVIGKSDIEGYYSEVSALDPALNGIYNGVFGFYDRFMLLYSEVASDEVLLASTNTDWIKFYDFTNTSSDEASALGYIWKNGYGIIGNCNQVIKYAPLLAAEYPDDEQTINAYLAQALFIRAFMHFEINLCYAQNYTYTQDASHLGIPVLAHIPSLTETIARNSVKEVYEQVIADLDAAITAFENSNWKGGNYFASELACKALLARVYLYMGNYPKALENAQSVISEVPLVPQQSYKAMFCTRNPAQDESIFRLNGFLQSSTTYKFFYWESPSGRPSERVKSLIGDTDIRKSLLDYSDRYSDIVMKYTCTDNVTTDEDRYYNPIILRSSEMYLIRAEALCMEGHIAEAVDDIKVLEARAMGLSKDRVIISCSTKQECLDLIEKERIKELCFEGHRFFDISRWHKNLTRTSDSSSAVKELKYPDYRFVLPIPQVELDANSAMINNPDKNE